MRVVDQERVKRYRNAYPDDRRTDDIILKALNEARKDKRHLNHWIERHVWEISRAEGKEEGK